MAIINNTSLIENILAYCEPSLAESTSAVKSRYRRLGQVGGNSVILGVSVSLGIRRNGDSGTEECKLGTLIIYITF
jgi:hypothetical protein